MTYGLCLNTELLSSSGFWMNFRVAGLLLRGLWESVSKVLTSLSKAI